MFLVGLRLHPGDQHCTLTKYRTLGAHKHLAAFSAAASAARAPWLVGRECRLVGSEKGRRWVFWRSQKDIQEEFVGGPCHARCSRRLKPRNPCFLPFRHYLYVIPSTAWLCHLCNDTRLHRSSPADVPVPTARPSPTSAGAFLDEVWMSRERAGCLERLMGKWLEAKLQMFTESPA